MVWWRRAAVGVLAGLGVALLAVGPVAAGAAAEPHDQPSTDRGREPPQTTTTWQSRLERGDRPEVPEDRHAPAGGCYTLAADGGGDLVRDDGGYAAVGDAGDGSPFHLQATDLGRYLLFDVDGSFLAASDGLVGEVLGEATGTPAGAVISGLSRGTSTEVAEELATGPPGELTGRGDAVEASEEPGELADWELTAVDDGFRLALPALGAALAATDDGEVVLVAEDEADGSAVWRLRLSDGCAEWPEVEINVDGAPAGGATPYTETRGYLDAHLHLMAYEFIGGRIRCGRPWHRYGVEHALRGCDEHEPADGRGHAAETALSGRDPVEGHDTHAGWPTFTDWPLHDSLTYEQTYHRWVERSWRGGLRLLSLLLVDNNVLCEAYPYKENSCNEMDGVRLQAERAREFERYVDAQHGGPGEGWFRIVTDPFEARRVINEGGLAVVLGMEVSRPFDCRLFLGVPQCDRDDVDREIDALHDLGVRQMELVNKFDNAFTGVAGDAGETGVAVNAGNVVETGRFWQMETCEEDDQDHGHGDHHHEGDAHDRRQFNLHDEAGTPDELTGRDSLVGTILQETGRSGAAPAYPQGPHCNVQGLSDLGEHVLHRMMDKGMLFDPDHMSARARHEAMDVIEEAGYSGVVSSHSWADDVTYQRVYEAGGVVTPMAGSSTGFVDAWRRHREWADERFTFGFGFGSDANGFATQGAPREPGEDEDPVTYPFEGLGGVVVDRQVSGERVYDVNVDGVAHYGLYPDWIEDLRRLAGDEIVADLERGPEAYLQLWERAVGVPPDACRSDVDPLTRGDLDGLESGATPEEVLQSVGQPRERTGQEFHYCLDDATATVRFDADGALAEIVVNDDGEDGDGGDSGGPRPDRPGRPGNPGPPSDRPPDHAHGHDHDGAMAPAAVAGDAWGPPLGSAAALVLGVAGLAAHVLGTRRRD